MMASEAKKAKMESSSSDLKTFKDFKIIRVLDDICDAKKIILEGQMANDAENTAVLILEKMPFKPEKVQEILSSSSLDTQFKNDIYGQYECKTESHLNSIKANLIYPATPKHIQKYNSSPRYLIQETPGLYKTVTLPFIKQERFAIDWLYNILDHKKETERIVYEDPDPENGFILLPDFKWSCKQVEDLYLLAIIHSRKIRSVRDLNQRHLPLLNKIWKESTKAIQERYGVHHSQIRAYFHYQPSYYHLHVHFTYAKYKAPGSGVEGAILINSVIENIQKKSNYYDQALLSFPVHENSGLFQAYKKAGYDFGHDDDKANHRNGDVEPVPMDTDNLLEFFKMLGQAKHEPCGEHWNVTYGESAWRLAIMAMCLSPDFDRKRLVKMALTSAFTSIGKAPDQNSEWEQKLCEVREFLCKLLPLEKASELYELYCCHVNGRRGVKPDSIDARAYRKLLELEEAILLWEEMQKEDDNKKKQKMSSLLNKMQEVGFPGTEQIQLFGSDTELTNLLTFFLKISDLTRLKRTGWVRAGVRDPERVAGHMFRMAVMAMLLEKEEDGRILNGSAVIISLVHDIAECIVGDITPSDNVSPEEKHDLEMKAMTSLVKNLPTTRIALEFFNAFERYEEQDENDGQAHLTKDLDKFDMIVQAFEYEEKAKKGAFLQDFFDSTQGFFKQKSVKAWDSRLRQRRQEMLESESNKA